MKWPFVRTSFHDNIVSQLIDREFKLGEENDRLNDVIANQMDSIKAQFNEINRLNQELANELNSHRETKEQKNELSAECDRLYDEVDNLKNELKETKDALKIAQEERIIEKKKADLYLRKYTELYNQKVTTRKDIKIFIDNIKRNLNI